MTRNFWRNKDAVGDRPQELGVFRPPGDSVVVNGQPVGIPKCRVPHERGALRVGLQRRDDAPNQIAAAPLLFDPRRDVLAQPARHVERGAVRRAGDGHQA